MKPLGATASRILCAVSLLITSLTHAQISSSSVRDFSFSSFDFPSSSGLSSDTIKKIAPDFKELFASLGIEVDLPRLERFLSDESRTLPALVQLVGPPASGRQYGSSQGPPCDLVFRNPGVISRVSSIELREINPQGKPAEWVAKLDKLQCAECRAALAAKLDMPAMKGIEAVRIQILMLMLAKEFQMVDAISSK